MRGSFLLFLVLSVFVVKAQRNLGPGGVGTTDGSSTLKLWYRVDNGVSNTAGTVDSWANSAGIAVLDIAETGSNRPTLVTGAVNGYDEISFNGSNRLVTAIGAITTTNFVTNQASTFVVCRADNTTQTSCVYTTDPLENAPGTRFSNHIPWSGTVYYDIGTCCANRIQVSGLSGLNNYSVWSYDAINTGTGKQLYRNGTLEQSVGVAALTYSGHATQRFNIGGNTSNGEAAGFVGDVTEVAIFTTKINSAQRIIIQNYLAAKYGIALSANDFYTRDDPGNGNYDNDVAGIGRVDGSNIHDDAQGTGVIRIFNPSGLGNGEYYFWGHDNGALQAQTTDVPAGLQGRLTRVWRGQETGNITDFDVEFDLTGLGPVTASNLRLLVDSNNDGVFATGVTVVTGATDQGNNIYRFSNVTDLTAGASNTRRFTLGSIDTVQTPLPITLLSFDVSAEEKKVKLQWQTAQEINNDYFTIERSTDGVEWEVVKTTPGKGTSNELNAYREYDERPYWGVSYYRLKQTDFDGTSTYSAIRSVTIARAFSDIVIYPNPAKQEFFIELPASENIAIKLYDKLGRECAVFPVNGKCGYSIQTNTLAGGVYTVYITNGSEHCYKKIVIE